MRFQIRHVTTYRYDRPVALGRHVFRMHPRNDGFLSVDSFVLSIHPPPAGFSPILDLEGNLAHAVWFEGLTQELRVSVRSSGETLPRPGPGFLPHLVDAQALCLPVDYGLERSALEPCLRGGPESGPVADFTASVATAAGGYTLSFLEILDGKLRENFPSIVRPTGDPLDPVTTLEKGYGSCRDLAVLFIACCRQQGLAARFVSGYVPAQPGEKQHMHAWAEVFLPGAGWRAFDSTTPLEAVAGKHIGVAAAAEPALATPVFGFFAGAGASSEMDIELSVEITETPTMEKAVVEL